MGERTARGVIPCEGAALTSALDSASARIEDGNANATAIARAHDSWRQRVGRSRSLSGKIAMLEEQVERFESPRSLQPENQARIARGAQVFEKAGCNACHPGPLRTDLKQYDLGTGRGVDVGKLFDAPTLVEIWRTAPYLHDGRAPDLRSVLTEHNPGDRYGKTSKFTEQELDDLVQFLLSL